MVRLVIGSGVRRLWRESLSRLSGGYLTLAT